MPEYIPGDHYVVIDKPDHIILPNIPQLGNLPHVWMWCRRSRPYVPVWSYAKVPKSKLSPNENGRLLNVYMRPWTLNPATATADNVLLSEMAFCKEGEGERANDETKPETSPRRRELQQSLEVPINAEGHEKKSIGLFAVCGEDAIGSANDRTKPDTSPKRRVLQEAPSAPSTGGERANSVLEPDALPERRCQQRSSTEIANVDEHKNNSTKADASPKRRRLQKSPEEAVEPNSGVRSHAKSWFNYINGNVVSDLARRYINNLLSVTAARIVEKDDESSDEEYKPKPFRATFGGLDLIQETLQGIATRDKDDGAQGIGRYAKTISIGRSLWETPSLSAAEAEEVHEPTFESTFPEEVQTYHKAAQAFIKQTEERPAPFEGKTEPYAHLSYKTMPLGWTIGWRMLRLRSTRKLENQSLQHMNS